MVQLEARTSVVGNRDDDGSGAGIKMARVEDIQEGEEAGPMTEETGGGGGSNLDDTQVSALRDWVDNSVMG